MEIGGKADILLMAQSPNIYTLRLGWQEVVLIVFMMVMLVLLGASLSLYHHISQLAREGEDGTRMRIASNMYKFNGEQLAMLLRYKKKKGLTAGMKETVKKSLCLAAAISVSFPLLAQTSGGASSIEWGNMGIVITLILIIIPLLFGIALMVVKVRKGLHRYRRLQRAAQVTELAKYLDTLNDTETLGDLTLRKEALAYQLTHHELSGDVKVSDKRGLIVASSDRFNLPIAATKKKALNRPYIDNKLSRLVLWYLGASAFWLLFGTTVGQYVGIKFLAPDIDQLSWLSFGRLRPVHTNAVFWGWASLAMLGLGHYIVPRVSNAPLASLRYGWYSLALINATVLFGTISLMMGINNGGGEYREYIWPIMLPFATALVLTLINFFKTVAQRKTREIYIANWYIIAALMFVLVIVVAAYVPFWQQGLGETIIQGYYMHQGVGMWFMLFTLGIVYYFLPQQLNRPIYSYSLGILAFWTQILFYTVIGTHHFIFSAIPWWLQTVAIVGSAGMVIPVVAGTTNFLLTFKGAWHKVKDSYTLPFFLAGIIFYFTGSLQGTAEAFRYTNLIWHFTDFTVAHSHLTMYGIITFLLWGAIYAVVPRLTGKEPPQLTVGAHFWMALIGLLFYTFPLMYGGTLRGLMWLDGRPFMESVVMMAPYWLWRAIGGSLMWLAHVVFVYNFYKMCLVNREPDIASEALEKLLNTEVSSTPVK